MTLFSFKRMGSLALALLVALPAWAVSPSQPAITEARVEGGVLHILGANLGAGIPRITLGAMPLVVVAVTTTQVDAIVPATVVPGSYLLTIDLASDNGRTNAASPEVRFDEFWVTVGAAGPQGVPGPVGPDGVAGPPGSPGPSGPAGAQGPQGPQGPAGPAGKDGAPGLAGRDGAVGPAGKDGAAGPAGRDGAAGPVGERGPIGPAGAPGRDGADGTAGPVGPAGPAGSGAAIASIYSLGGLPCSVANCPGTTTPIAFDPLTSRAQFSCTRLPGTTTLRVTGGTDVGYVLRAGISGPNSLAFSSDVPGFAGPIVALSAGANVAFDIPVTTLCAGQAVAVTVTRFNYGDYGISAYGGSCNGDGFTFIGTTANSSVTCRFTMNGDQALDLRTAFRGIH